MNNEKAGFAIASVTLLVCIVSLGILYEHARVSVDLSKSDASELVAQNVVNDDNDACAICGAPAPCPPLVKKEVAIGEEPYTNLTPDTGHNKILVNIRC